MLGGATAQGFRRKLNCYPVRFDQGFMEGFQGFQTLNLEGEVMETDVVFAIEGDGIGGINGLPQGQQEGAIGGRDSQGPHPLA